MGDISKTISMLDCVDLRTINLGNGPSPQIKKTLIQSYKKLIHFALDKISQIWSFLYWLLLAIREGLVPSDKIICKKPARDFIMARVINLNNIMRS